jgi:SAM-dependent methyltransferase
MPGRVEPHDHVDYVAAGYDLVGDDYYRHYRTVPTQVVERYESLFIENVPAGGSVLDLGCGNGLPMTAKFTDRFEVTAVDVSDAQIDRARSERAGAALRARRYVRT